MIKFLLGLLGLPFKIGTSRLAHGAHVTRYVMYETLSKVLNEDGKGKRLLSISHSERLVDVMGLRGVEVVQANYPEYNALDLSRFEDESFDYVVSDQVLEHIAGDPFKVFEESRRVLRKGGIAVHTTCFINPIHGWPSDFWRFTPNCLSMLASEFSDILAVGGHGSRLIWIIDLMGLRDTPVPHAKWHPLHKIATFNMPSWPMSTWVVARK